jgi:hypothetical protein
VLPNAIDDAARRLGHAIAESARIPRSLVVNA